MPEKTNSDPKILGVFVTLRERLARSVLGIVPPKEVEDIVQETYVRVCQLDEDAAMVHPKALLYKIAKNLALDHAKRADNRMFGDEDPDFLTGSETGSIPIDEPLDGAIARERFADFCMAVRRLPQQRRRAFVLKKVYGYSQREIANHMGLSEKTVENYIGKAMQSCFEYLNRHDESISARPFAQPNAGVSRRANPESE